MPVQNPFGLSFSGNITQWDNTPLSPPSAFGTCPGLGCCSTVTAAIPVNASLFVGSCTALSATSYGSPAVEALNVYVTNPVTATFTETQIGVTQVTSPWVVSGTVAISNASICVTQCTSPWVVSGTVAFSNTTIAVTNTGTFAVQIPTPTDWGTAPATSVLVPAVNAEMFVGQNAVSGTNPVPISATTAANTSGNPIYVDVTNFPATSTFQGNLTNNNAAPNAFNVGVLPAIAETAYTTVTYTTGDQVLPVTDLHGALNVDWQALAGTALGGPTDWGTAPAASTEVQGVNAELFVGQNPVSATAPVPISATAAANTSGNPIFVSAAVTGTVAVTQSTTPWVTDVTQWANTNLGIPTSWGTAPTGAVIGVNAELFSGTTAIGATGTSLNVDVTNFPTTFGITGTVAVTQSTSPWVVSGTVSLSGTSAVDGTLTNNNAAPTATLLGVLGAIAETAYNTVTYTTGDMVLPVTDLHGALNSDLQAVAGVQLGATAVTAFGTAPAAVNVPAVNASLFSGTTPLTNTGGALNVNVTGFSGGTLSNDTAAPIANNEGSLTAIAATSYTTQTYTNGFQVLPVTDLHGALNQDLQAVGGVQIVAAVSAYGTAPTGTAVMGVNAFITNTVTVAGNRGNNTAVPGTANLSALVSVTAPSDTTFPTYVAGNESLLVTDLSGNLNTDVQYWGGSDLGAPSNYGTSPGAVIVPGVNAFVTNTVAVAITPATTGGVSPATGSIGATKTAIKTTAGQVYGWYFYNSNTSVAYVQFFNASVASVTLGTTAPFMSFGIPPVAGANVLNDMGIAFGTAITIAITTTRAGATGPTNTVDYNVFYE